MARVHSLIKISGSLGDLTYFMREGKCFVRQRTSVDREQMATDPRFKRTREVMAEFGRAGKAGKLIRTALSDYFIHPPDARLSGRLTAELFKVIRGDQLSPVGSRTVSDGDIHVLEGFSFYKKGLNGVYCEPSIDRQAGRILTKIIVNSHCHWRRMPASATHTRVAMIAVELDFEKNLFVTKSHMSSPLPFVSSGTELELLNMVTPHGKLPLLLLVRTELLSVSGNSIVNVGGMEFNNIMIIAAEKAE